MMVCALCQFRGIAGTSNKMPLGSLAADWDVYWWPVPKTCSYG